MTKHLPLNFLKITFVICLFALSKTHSGFFLENDEVPITKKVSFFSYGGGFSTSYYLSAFDFGIDLYGQFRIFSHHTLNPFIGFNLSEPIYEAGFDWHWLFWGTFREDTFENYFRLGFSEIIFEKGEKWYTSPRIFVGYGRDTRPWKNAEFLFRIGLRLSYLLGESIGRDISVYGIEQIKLANTVIHGEFSILLF